MKYNKRILETAIAKTKPHSTREWCGYFSCAEINQLTMAGAILSHPSQFMQEYGRKKWEAGIEFQTWYYFTAKKELHQKLLERHPRKRYG